jgi:DNA helicase HerA-like ATPase
MRPNPELDIEKTIMELGVGEALVSLLDAGGTPGITRRAWINAPGSRIGPITPEERRQLIESSVVAGVYEKEVDRESAMEVLRARTQGAAAAPSAAGAPAAPTIPGAAPAASGANPMLAGALSGLGALVFGSTGPRGGRHDGLVDLMAKSAARSAGSAIMRGVLGSIMGGRRSR